MHKSIDARFAELRGIVFQVCFAKFADIQHVPLRQTVLCCGFTFWEDLLDFSDWSKLYVYFVHTWNINRDTLTRNMKSQPPKLVIRDHLMFFFYAEVSIAKFAHGSPEEQDEQVKKLRTAMATRW